ncbi:MAG: hypothetical protein GC190_18555 [Alphaproteobacteria bacterium]|nr:hypothetical protein [Alphaproteobacteria bacterium]
MIKNAEDYFIDDEAARAKLEALRWPRGAVCPRCGESNRIYVLAHIRRGLKKCGRCRRQFTVRTATLLEGSHVPLHKWLQAIGISSTVPREHLGRELSRTLALEPRAARFVANRLSGASRLAHKQPSDRRESTSKTPSAGSVNSDGVWATFEQTVAHLLSTSLSRVRQSVKRKKPVKRRRRLAK